MKNLLASTALLLFLCSFGLCQTTESSKHKHFRHKVSCLCGTVQICRGDICGSASTYGLDDDITVELRDKSDRTALESKKVFLETRKRECTTQAGKKVSCDTKERSFCFEGKPEGEYQLAFILFKKGVPQLRDNRRIKYSHKWHKPCDSIYMIEPE